MNPNIAQHFDAIEVRLIQSHVIRYSFHWQDAQGKLKQRWDNAPHHPELPNFPHHVHNQDRSVHGVITVPDIFSIIDQIEKAYD